MNKTITINLSGILIHINDDAYDMLRNYLQALHQHFSATEGKEEILQDIESRIAEIFQSKLNERKQVIVKEDVEETISILGKPEELKSEDTEEKKQTNTYANTRRRYRLYRDESNRVFGGVCSGLAHYFDIDPVWVRLAFVVSVIGFGFGTLLYIILWIIIPKATTTEEKLEMRGERFTISDIEQNVKEEFNEVKQKFRKQYKDGKYKERSKTALTEAFGLFGKIFYYFAKIVVILISIFLVGLCISILIALFFGLFGAKAFVAGSGAGMISLTSGLNQFFFNSPMQGTIIVLAVLLLIAVPMLMLMYGLIKTIFGIRYHSRILGWSAFGIWILALIILAFHAIKISNFFSYKEQVKTTQILLPVKSDTIYVKTNIDEEDCIMTTFDDEDICAPFRYSASEHSLQTGLIHFKRAPLKIVQTEGDKMELVITKVSFGNNAIDAQQRASNIKYKYMQQGSVLLLNNFINIPESDKWRAQHVMLMLKIPKNKKIMLDANSNKMLYQRHTRKYRKFDDEEKTWVLYYFDDGDLSKLEQ